MPNKGRQKWKAAECPARLARADFGVCLINQPHVGQFFLSTRPEVAPSEIVRSVKGRWQYLIRTQNPSAFRRNYFVGSLDDAACRVLDQYVAGQTDKHSMVDANVQKRLQSLQFHDAIVDLAQAQTTSHGRFVYRLQVVVENLDGLHDLRETVLADSRAMILGAAAKKR